MKVVKLSKWGYVSRGGDDTTVMYPKQEQSENTMNRAPFWAVLERTAALVEADDRVKLPELVELGGDGLSVGPGDTRPVESDSQRPREVFAHIRGLLGDVEADDEPEALSRLVGDGQGAVDEATVAPAGEEDKPSQQDPLPGVDGELVNTELEVGVQRLSGELLFEVFPEVPPSEGQPLADALVEDPSDRVEEIPAVESGPMYEFGAHSTVIPGTEEFMDSLARKNRAFEHTGEIDTDLDRAADKLGWNRTDDDLVVKRKIFKKKKK